MAVVDFGTILNNEIVIFGTGRFSEYFTDPMFQIVYYVDNNKDKWGTLHRGKEVLNPNRLMHEAKDSITIIVASMFYEEISSQLAALGFKEGVHFYNGLDVVNYYFKNEFAKIEQFKGIHEGKRAFIIGNGPSLKIDDLNKLQNEITFASNKIFLAFDETDWRPSYYTMLDVLVAESCKTEIAPFASTNKFFSTDIFPVFGKMETTYWLNKKNTFDENNVQYVEGFSDDVAKMVYGGASVTYLNIQLAYYMGIREIYLIGIDYHYPDLPNKTKENPVYVNEREQVATHFHPSYNKVGEKNYLPELRVQYEAFQLAAQFFHKNNGKIYNASRSTRLDVFPIVNFDDVI